MPNYILRIGSPLTEQFIAFHPQHGIHFVHSADSQKASHFVRIPEGCGIQARHVQ